MSADVSPEAARMDDLWTILLRNAEKRPDHPALITPEAQFTYREIREQALAVAAGLMESGVQPGDTMILAMGNVPEFVPCFLATIYVGAVAAPLNPALTSAETRTLAATSGARFGLFSTLRGMLAAEGESFRAVPLDGDDQSIRGWMSSGRCPAGRPIGVQPDALALVQASSGSMGKPKLVERTHAQLVAEATCFSRATKLTCDDRILAAVPLFHCHGLGNCLLTTLFHGATMVLLERFEPHSVVNALAQWHVTVFPGVPVIFGILNESKAAGRFPALKLCFSAGGPLPERTYRAFKRKFGVGIVQLYGCTEAGAITINLDEDLDRSNQCVGRPLAGIELRVVDEASQDVPVGEVGQVVIKGGGLMRGYHKVDSDGVFRDSYFLTGDLGRLDERGRLTLTGRRKLFINVGGHKIDPMEIEEVIRRHEDVEDVVVVGEPTRFGDEMIKAAVVPARPMEAWQIVEHCRACLSPHKVPKIVVFVDAVPRSPLGKVLRGKV
jgi:long-chain acyl-CoA synthetase